jgi:hypothetical protein
LRADRGAPRVAGGCGTQGDHEIEAVLADGVRVAADVQAILDDVLVGQQLGDLLLGPGGPRVTFTDVVRDQVRCFGAESKDIAFVAAAELQQVASGRLCDAATRAG